MIPGSGISSGVGIGYPLQYSWASLVAQLVKKVKVKVAQSSLTLCDPMDFTGHGILQARMLEWVAFPLSRDLPNPGIEPKFPALQADSLPAEPQGKHKSTGVGSLSLPQWIFQTQESNRSLLHCRRILYQLSYEGSYLSPNSWLLFLYK